MRKYVTLKDVALKAGTTASTVSYVLSNKQGRYISEETRSKVMQAVHELDYIKSNSAASLKGKQIKLIGILVPQFENQFFTHIIVACEKVCMKYGYDLIICDTLDKPSREHDFIRRMVQQRVDGIIITSTVEGKENTSILRRLGIPTVAVDRPLDGLDDYYWVTTNNYQCGEAGALHLKAKGHRKIAYIGWNTQVSDLLERCNAVKSVYGDDAIISEGEFSDEGGYQATEWVLSHHPEVTAFFYGFNMQAKGGLKCLSDHGKTIGKDVSVVILGSPEWVMAGNNSFTHVAMNDYELGAKAAEVLMDIIAGGQNAKDEKRVIQDCTLIEGTSVVDMNDQY